MDKTIIYKRGIILMKNLFKGLLTVLLSLALAISVVASGITENSDLLPEVNTEISGHKDEEKEPDCNTNCDLPVLDMLEEDY